MHSYSDTAVFKNKHAFKIIPRNGKRSNEPEIKSSEVS